MKLYRLFLLIILILNTVSCNPKGSGGEATSSSTEKKNLEVPHFNADSAYSYIARQVAFGPRVPNTPAHKQTAGYLTDKLKSYGAAVIVQEAQLTAFDGKILQAKNIIGQFNPENNNRILLFAHWDCRPFSDHDSNPANYNKPVDGANDGASGVGVLLEIARQLQANPIKTGIDIIFFDAEDYGMPDHLDLPYKADTWCLGSQYWAQNPHKPNYYARYGILLDMVGGKDATFFKEYFSVQTAGDIVNKIWQTAGKLGYGNYFILADGGAITDDHIYVNKYLGIPCVDIIQYNPSSQSGFGDYWHTTKDNMDAVDKNTLKAVGQTVLQVLYNE